MRFGDALNILKSGGRVARGGWNGKDMFLFMVNPTPAEDADSIGVSLPNSVRDLWDLPQLPFLCMKTAQNTINVGWLASQTDMLAEDWMEVQPPAKG